MVAVLSWCDTFGTYVQAIFPNADQAREYAEINEPYESRYPWHFMTFSYGEVEFDYYEADETI